MQKRSRTKAKNKPRALYPPWCRTYVANACAACGDWAKIKRSLKWCCLSCRKLPPEKFEAACEEWDRIKAAARDEIKAAAEGRTRDVGT